MSARRFVVDTMLGRLARWLRAMGYDTVYLGPAHDHRLLQLAFSEDRLLLTRDAKLARLAGPRGRLVRGEPMDRQLAEVVEDLALAPPDQGWLSRCLDCNTLLEPRVKETLQGVVPEYVFANHTEFVGCPGCGKIYWPGTHADRMLARLRELLGREQRSR